MLAILILIPLIGTIMISLIEDKNTEKIKDRALLISIIAFIYSIIIWTLFDGNSDQYQFVSQYNNVDFCHLYIGIDGLSIYFIILTTMIIPVSILASRDNITEHLKFYYINILLLEALLLIIFSVIDILLFYIFFESVLIPLFFIIGMYGHGENRIRASFLLFLYTLLGSLFMLLAFLIIYYNVGSTDLQIINLMNIDIEYQKILFLMIFLSFAIKTPLIPFHIWLPKAHTEAPLGGSIILASLILKLAAYGYIRILLKIFPDASNYFSPLVYVICIVTIIYSSLTTLRQTDFKALIAYSSIGHMGIIVLGIFSNNLQGIEGSIILSIAHGLVSPALFICVGGILLERYKTRVIKYYRGITIYMPIFSVLFFLFSLSNIAVPLTINFIGEFLSLVGAYQKSIIATILACSSMILSASYTIWLYNRLAFGTYGANLPYVSDINIREYFILLYLFFPTLFLGLLPNIVLDNIHYTISTFLY